MKIIIWYAIVEEKVCWVSWFFDGNGAVDFQLEAYGGIEDINISRKNSQGISFCG